MDDADEQDVGDEYDFANEEDSYADMGDPFEQETEVEYDIDDEARSYQDIGDQDVQNVEDEYDIDDEARSYPDIGDPAEQEIGDEYDIDDEARSYPDIGDTDEQEIGDEYDIDDEAGSYRDMDDPNEQEVRDEYDNDEESEWMPRAKYNNSNIIDQVKKQVAIEDKGRVLVLQNLPPAKTQEESVPAGFGRVKNILFKKDVVLGRGCNGTIVYRGRFDERDVAVKRILREYFDLADREVKLLRESDQHPNVIRYYCMEEDNDFLFIALELCYGTLQDYVEDKLQNIKNIKPIELLHQALSGLAHLHSLVIVHRDLKPHNILISMPNAQGEVRAMISDFGLSKMLPPGRMSFSSKSDVFGTVGWTAPEMLESGVKKTCAVDIFSAGCLMYYVLTKGKHPFGSEISLIPHNIMKGIFNLESLPMTSDGYVAKDIIQKMLSQEPGTRPTAKTALHHPLFWCKEKKLAFIQDASDWIEVKMVNGLEQDGAQIVNGDWINHLAQEVQDNIKNDYKKRRRHYDRTTVRDLLRVIRNKKHHYNEMPESVKKSLGSLPEQFLDHFTSRFPKLLIHTYSVMECCAKEDAFKAYYISE